MNNVFGKTMENVGEHGNIKIVTTERRRNHLVSKSNYNTTKFCRENILAIGMRKTQIEEQACLFRFINIRSE